MFLFPTDYKNYRTVNQRGRRNLSMSNFNLNMKTIYYSQLMFVCVCGALFHLLQYGSEEFGQDSPRYTSPKAATLYADPYYIGNYAILNIIWILEINVSLQNEELVDLQLLSIAR